ncbi:MAG: hypothetical protein GTN38_01030 [Candidatus Aenigmarchaeota archaeon]|nr:hypothetical protein [Candidatus Aenigmarchaeota archaeon]NIP40171.1 hypothetical protein [Candidatus Aenigmarchaeota archaeon]NIQ17215.1 hypothetical protein [Candidatus Aenigmarchaeota archaeon]NIS73005.1 hypothetical protein [Candidatus Aenigmarchaeota archaeon]
MNRIPSTRNPLGAYRAPGYGNPGISDKEYDSKVTALKFGFKLLEKEEYSLANEAFDRENLTPKEIVKGLDDFISAGFSKYKDIRKFYLENLVPELKEDEMWPLKILDKYRTAKRIVKYLEKANWEVEAAVEKYFERKRKLKDLLNTTYVVIGSGGVGAGIGLHTGGKTEALGLGAICSFMGLFIRTLTLEGKREKDAG